MIASETAGRGSVSPYNRTCDLRLTGLRPLGAHVPPQPSELLIWPRPRGQCGLWALYHAKVTASCCADLGGQQGAGGSSCTLSICAQSPSFSPLQAQQLLCFCCGWAGDILFVSFCQASQLLHPGVMMICKQLLQSTREHPV